MGNFRKCLKASEAFWNLWTFLQGSETLSPILECWSIRKLSKALRNLRTPPDTMGNLRKRSNAFGSLANILTPSGPLVAFGNPNLDPGVLVPSETFESFWELADAFGHSGKASQVFERLRKPRKYSDACGTFASFRKPES